MYITYCIYRSKNNDFIARRRISLPIDGFRQILNLDGLLLSVMKRDVHNIPMIQKFGTAYIGNYQCEQVEITDEDDTDAMNEEQFREYFKEIADVPLVWSKTEEVSNGEESTDKESEHKTGESNSKDIGNEENP